VRRRRQIPRTRFFRMCVPSGDGVAGVEVGADVDAAGDAVVVDGEGEFGEEAGTVAGAPRVGGYCRQRGFAGSRLAAARSR
jgi:hypothetical protein